MVEGFASFILAQKLKLLKECVVRWKNEEFGGIEARKLQCLSKIEKLELKGMVGGLNEEVVGMKLESK